MVSPGVPRDFCKDDGSCEKTLTPIPDEVAHLVAVLHLGVTGETPEDCVDQGLGNVLLQVLDHHGEVRVGVVVVEDVPYCLVKHGEKGPQSPQPSEVHNVLQALVANRSGH